MQTISNLKIQLGANLRGVAVRISSDPSIKDPYGKVESVRQYPDLASALQQIPDFAMDVITGLEASNATD